VWELKLLRCEILQSDFVNKYLQTQRLKRGTTGELFLFYAKFYEGLSI
jgi:hypothetical protein